jgi:alpha-tubulin suppressor-like RCC1 family protein
VQCWGTDSVGEIGGGDRDGGVYAYTPVRALVSANATAIALGASHSCAVLVDQTVQCWGYNYDGELGNGGTANSNVPVAVKNLSLTVGLSGGEFHTCAVVSSGAVYCWGANGAWQLGPNGGSGSLRPVLVTGFGP